MEGDGRRDFDGDAAQLAVALGGVAVAEKEIGVLVQDRKVDDGAGADVGHVHVAAPVIGLQCQLTASISGLTPSVPMKGS